MIGRFVRIILIVRIITEKKHLEKASRLAVSQNKRRYQKDGFDLDLCYIAGSTCHTCVICTTASTLRKENVSLLTRLLLCFRQSHCHVVPVHWNDGPVQKSNQGEHHFDAISFTMCRIAAEISLTNLSTSVSGSCQIFGIQAQGSLQNFQSV